MDELNEKGRHIRRILESAQAVRDAKDAFEQAKVDEMEAVKRRLAMGVAHREAIESHQKNLIAGWKARIEISELLEAGKLSKSRLYQLIEKFGADYPGAV
ncbi:hypothetical protein [Actinokineospora sp. NBRC 105648]|uniref:hypothetical protein n=1 Tax=Actinokineospora sp. NBRC 105648 TaxID=3032206 RepID=UPI0024A1EFDB|nr:hypothetical protein [Actinokineospora sp. NBRC 105648]GLZ37864.1 hypothetical protein Acsp05_14880 [Actinokineospora sp. NBRC 105648]